jgi:hypothetical protein
MTTLIGIWFIGWAFVCGMILGNDKISAVSKKWIAVGCLFAWPVLLGYGLTHVTVTTRVDVDDVNIHVTDIGTRSNRGET